MNKRLIAPVGFIQVEAVLLGLSVKCHQPLMVHTRLAALVSRVGREIEHVPDVCRPHPRMALEAFEHVLVVNCLILLRVISSLRGLAVKIRHALRAVLAVAESPLRPLLVEETEEQVVQLRARDIPAEVQVVADQVADLVHNAVKRIAHRIACKRRKSRPVHLVAEIVERSVVAHHVRVVLCRYGDLIGDTPADDARMVIVLNDQFLHLADRVLAPFRHMFGNVRNFGPDNHAVLIAQIIEILIVLIVGESDRICSDLADERHVLVVLGLADCISHALAVLMPRYAVKRVRYAVQDKSLFGVKFERANAEPDLSLVHDLPVRDQHEVCRVEIRILHAVPEMRLIDSKNRLLTFTGCDNIAFCIEDLNADLTLPGDPALNSHFGFAAHDERGDLHARSAVMIHVKVILLYDQYLYGSVDAAIECEVCLLRIDTAVHGVIHFHAQLVLFCEELRDVRSEGGIAPVMLHDGCAVHEDFGGGICSVQLEIDLLCLRIEVRSLKGCLIVAGSAEIIVSSVLTVQGVPGVRQIHLNRVFPRLCEHPVFVQNDFFSHVFPSPRHTWFLTVFTL